MNSQRLFVYCLASLCLASVGCSYVDGIYTELPQGTVIDLTADGTIDWVKWGNGGNGELSWTTVRKAGGSEINTALSPLGTAPQGANVLLAAFTPPNPSDALLNFNWTNGNNPAAGTSRSVVTETILPAQFSYPLGLGARFSVNAAEEKRILDVYTQGFNADVEITATLSGGRSDSIVISPSLNPTGDAGNDYSCGRYSIEFMGDGQVLTVTIRTRSPVTTGTQSAFPNAGFFAAALREAPPEQAGAQGFVRQVGRTANKTVRSVASPLSSRR